MTNSGHLSNVMEGEDEEYMQVDKEEIKDELGSNFKVRFRNYAPKDEQLQQRKIPRPSVPSISKEITDKLSKIANEEPDWDSMSLAPKKANWDLKRDAERKLEKLELRTQKAIVEMMREKLQLGTKDDLNRNISLRSAKDVESDSEDED
eukprot:TRINITY_DN1343_c0_g1_i1.p1 TRINITY_DN1343_c0_g1~~TRINITY_DN1343_c0_g1_i1.p1  ORF type:complete len:149 (+),score=50.01 TRINITY_DN1343_c0_g1_i1:39-485(+)